MARGVRRLTGGDLPAGPWDRDTAAALWLPKAESYARGLTRHRPDLTEEVRDGAVTGLVLALNRFTAAAGWPMWERFAAKAISRRAKGALRRAMNKPRPDLLGEYADAVPDRTPTPEPRLSADTLRALPPDLRRACEMYLIDGHTLRQCADRLGCSKDAVRKRLLAAAKRLGLGLPASDHHGAKRLKRG